MSDQPQETDGVQKLQQEHQEIANAQQEKLNAAVPEDPRNKPNPVAGGFAGDTSTTGVTGGAEDQTPVNMAGTPAEGDEETQKTEYPEPAKGDQTPKASTAKTTTAKK